MRIYLAQHSSAIAKEVDPGRPLSEEGRGGDLGRLARSLEGAGVRVGQVLHSGELRAEQTATLLGSVLLPTVRAQARAGLSPNDPVEPLASEMETWTAIEKT